ncbi:MAG: hypothetical protein ACTS2F_01180 [Thainema sp.]
MNKATALKLLWYWSRRSSDSGSLREQSLSPSTEDGLTLLECIMAILVIVVTVTIITPPIFLSVATRVQNQRMEQALQLAQAEIDRVNLIVERGLYANTELPPSVGAGNVSDTGAPSGTVDERADVTNSGQAYEVDIDNDGDSDYAVQFFRTDGQTGTGDADDQVLAFNMGVRVYSMLAFDNGGTLTTQQAPALFTSGTGSQNTDPLAVLYTTVARGDAANSFSALDGEED